LSEDVARLEEALSNPNEEARYAGLCALAGRTDRLLLGPLLRALGDESWRVRREAIEALSLHPERETVAGALMGILTTAPSEAARSSAAEVVLRLGRGVYKRLTRLLASGGAEARRRAATLLGELGETAAVPSLAAALVDQDRPVRIAAAEALGAIGNDGAAQALMVAVESVRDVGTRLACLDALARLGRPPPFAALADAARHAALRRVALRLLAHAPDPEAVTLALDALGDPRHVDREAALVVLDALRRHGFSPEELERARDALARDDFGIVREALQSPSPEVRRAASALAGWLGATTLAPDLAHAARQGSAGEAALEALEAMGESAVEALLHAAAGAAPSDRAAAIEALGRLSAPAALPLCREALEDPHPIVAAAAARALAGLGDAQDLRALLAAMERGSRPLLEAGGESLRFLGGRHPEALAELARGWPLEARDDVNAELVASLPVLGESAEGSLLRGALAQGGPRTRRAAARAIAELGAEAFAFDLARLLDDERAEVRLAAVEALAQLAARGGDETGEVVFAAVERGLGDASAEVRAAAAAALVPLGPARAVLKLPKLASSPDPAVARAAVDAVRALGARAHLADRLAVLEQALLHEHAEVVRAAVAALGEVEDRAALAPLGSALSHPRFEVRMAAAAAIGGRGEDGRTALRERLPVEEDPLVREAIRRALSEAG
jgi:HEAT repeat protein